MSSGQGWDALWYGFNKNKFCSCIWVWDREKFFLKARKIRKKGKTKGHKTHHFQSVFSEMFQVLSRGLHQVQQVRSLLRARLWRCLFAQFLLFHTMVCNDDVSFKTCCLARKTSAHAYFCCCLVYLEKNWGKKGKKVNPKKPKVKWGEKN